jgi:Flp pilus assembly protein TadD
VDALVAHKLGAALKKSGRSRILGLAFLLCGLGATFIFAQSTPGQNATAAYAHPFGSNPYLPSRALAQFDGFLPPEAFPKADYCSRCHAEVHAQWRQSAHANSFREPFYLKNVDLLIQQKGIEHTRHCEGCHNPVALFSGALTTGSKVDRSSNADGITCTVCHSIARIQDTGGTGSYVMGVPAVMVREDGTPVTGVVSDADILRRPDLHRKAVMRDFYRTAEFCSVCHQAEIPKALNGYKTLRPFAVYNEWQQSAWAGQSPLPFYRKDTVSTCQDCHMAAAEARHDPAAVDGKVPSHRWAGANTAIPAFYGYSDQLRETEQFLKKAVSIDIFALTKSTDRRPLSIAPLDRESYSLSASDQVAFDVVILNQGIGHSLVPEQRDFYEAWVEFQVLDAAGKALFHSGFLGADGSLDRDAHSYTSQLLSAEGGLLDHHQVWDLRVRAYDNTIMPGRADVVRYQLRIPAGARGPLTVVAKVNYRRFRKSYTDWVLGQALEFPVVTMAEQTAVLNLGANASHLAFDPPQEARRWNNYGIAQLDKQQYSRAADAFREVVRLQPTYADGYINIAIAELSQGEYETALRSLQTALAADPTSDRAVTYRGLVYRLQYDFDKAIKTLKPIVGTYPKLRLARQELGYAYFLKKQYALAQEQYEALQQVDPNDVAAFRYLAAIYKVLGLEAKSAEQGAGLAARQDDPASAYLVQRYWIMHPSIAYEVSPLHVHGADPRAEQATVNQLLKTSAIWPFAQ